MLSCQWLSFATHEWSHHLILKKLNDGEEGLFPSPYILSVVTDSMQNTSVRESERYSPSQEILYILWDLKFH